MHNRRQQLMYKQDRCHLCSRMVPDVIERFGPKGFHKVFQFHHVDPDTKHSNYDNLIRRSISTEQLDELDKCVLLCNWCHGLLENQSNRVTARIQVHIAGRTAEQTIEGQVLIDQVSRVASFVTNERVKVIPYLVRLGNADSRLDFGTDLETGQLLVEYLGKLEEYRRISIRRWHDRQWMMEAKYMEPGQMRVKHDVTFPIFNSELRGRTPVWTRNGVGLTVDGEVHNEGVVEIEGKIPTKITSGG